MFEIKNKKELAPQIVLLDISAPLIAQKAKPGQFVVVIATEKSERIPLTISDWDKIRGTIRLIFQVVGFSTKKLATLSVGDKLLGLLGPLGNAHALEKIGNIICIGGGVGIAEILPIARGFKKISNKVISIIGSRNRELLILECELQEASDELFITTDDGSAGRKGFVTDCLKELLETRKEISKDNSLIYAVGPVKMMQKVAQVSRPTKIKTLVSLNPIMLDATGMCGACRVRVDGKVRFACVDGPEFDAQKVDFENLLMRLDQHKELEHKCKLGDLL
ncbi:MAG: sulfide/dihydroorotate dehydrogenase-like FAD/NAD-binding protein [Candidatus Omnitrophota bacterium]